MINTRVTEEKKHPKKENFLRREIAYGITGKEWIASITGGIVSGIAAMTRLIHTYFYDDVKKAPDFETIFKERLDELNKVTPENVEATNTKGLFKPTGYAEKVREIKQTSDGKLEKALFEKRAIRQNLILGTYDRFTQLSKSSRGKLYFNTTAGALVGAAMTLSFFNGVATRDRIERIEDAVTAKSPPER